MHILSQFWPFLANIPLIFTGESKNFGTHITAKPPRHLVSIVFWSGMKDAMKDASPGEARKLLIL